MVFLLAQSLVVGKICDRYGLKGLHERPASRSSIRSSIAGARARLHRGRRADTRARQRRQCRDLLDVQPSARSIAARAVAAAAREPVVAGTENRTHLVLGE